MTEYMVLALSVVFMVLGFAGLTMTLTKKSLMPKILQITQDSATEALQGLKRSDAFRELVKAAMGEYLLPMEKQIMELKRQNTAMNNSIQLLMAEFDLLRAQNTQKTYEIVALKSFTKAMALGLRDLHKASTQQLLMALLADNPLKLEDMPVLVMQAQTNPDMVITHLVNEATKATGDADQAHAHALKCERDLANLVEGQDAKDRQDQPVRERIKASLTVNHRGSKQ